MAAHIAPEEGDVIVREDVGEDGRVRFILHAALGADQYVIHGRDEAIAKAVAFARHGHVRVWLTDSSHECSLLEDFRVVKAMLERIRAEFLEMPGLRLTVGQAERLCGVDRELCKAVLDALVDARFLCVKSDGAYARLTDGGLHRDHPGQIMDR